MRQTHDFARRSDTQRRRAPTWLAPLLAATTVLLAASGCASTAGGGHAANTDATVLAPGPGSITVPTAAPSAGFALVRDAYRAVDKIERMRVVLRGRSRTVDPVADAPTTRCYERILAGADLLYTEARERAAATDAAVRTGDRLGAEQAWQTVRVHEQTVALWTETGCATGISTR